MDFIEIKNQSPKYTGRIHLGTIQSSMLITKIYQITNRKKRITMHNKHPIQQGLKKNNLRSGKVLSYWTMNIHNLNLFKKNHKCNWSTYIELKPKPHPPSTLTYKEEKIQFGLQTIGLIKMQSLWSHPPHPKTKLQ